MMMTLAEIDVARLAALVPLAPLLGTVLVGLIGVRWLRSASHWPVLVGVLIALGVSASLLVIVHETPAAEYGVTHVLYSWISPAAGVWFNVDFRVDPLTVIMLVTVCTVSLLVVIYSRDYMREHGHAERGYERFFAFMGLFVFSMAVLVLSGNFLLLFLGWEAVGLCSYLLIGFYYPRPAAAAAAKKAFLVNRIGDFGFGLGILCIYLWVSPHVTIGENPLDYAVVFHYASIHFDEWQFTTVSLLLFCGAVGKSAQIPLYVWLPDAMEGPSPVSALIHAATMVTAGVYMVARCGPIFARSPAALAVVAAVGAITAVFAATMALAQYDMKRILAYSTVSQLGYMFLGLGVCAADSAVFHLFTHAFFKGLLFLGAGAVMHGMGGIIDVRRFSGLRRVMPVTYVTFVAGGLALAGFPLTAGFFSKDEIIHRVYTIAPVVGPLLALIALVAALLTAFYTFRMIFLAFHGQVRVPEGVHAHECGLWMRIPLMLLAVGALGAGYVGTTFGSGFLGFVEPHGMLHHFLHTIQAPFNESPLVFHRVTDEGDYVLMYVSSAIAVAGIAGAYVLYARRRDWAESLLLRMPDGHQLLYDRYYVDELYDTVVVQPLRRVGAFFYAVDTYLIDGLVWFVSAVPRAMGFVLRGVQGGALQGYAATMVAGLVVILLLMLAAR